LGRSVLGSAGPTDRAEDPNPFNQAQLPAGSDDALSAGRGIDRVDPARRSPIANGADEDRTAHAHLDAIQAGVRAKRGDHALDARLRVHPQYAASIAIPGAARVAHYDIPACLHRDVHGVVEQRALGRGIAANECLDAADEIDLPDLPRIGALDVSWFIRHVNVV